jgi:hypothetical protein
LVDEEMLGRSNGEMMLTVEHRMMKNTDRSNGGIILAKEN